MNQKLTLDDIEVGQCWLSPSRTISESDVSNFAWLTGDFNPLHMDEEFARNTPFRKPIAHGLLGLSFVAGLGSESPLVDTVAFVGINNWKFLKPVFFGDTVHVRTVAVSKEPRGRRYGLVTWQRQLINQSGAVVQEGTFETLVSIPRPSPATASRLMSAPVGHASETPASIGSNASLPSSS